MTSRRRGRRAPESLLATAWASPWPVAAALAIGCLLLAYLVIPAALGGAPAFAPIAEALAYLLRIAAVVFAVIALLRWLGSLAQPRLRVVGGAEDSRPWPASPDFGDPRGAGRAAPAGWSLELLREIEWKRFEELVAAFLRATGYRVETLRCGADGGVDARVYKGDELIAIAQCKAWNRRPVGVKPVRELLGVMAHERVGAGLFFATGEYTDEALAFAKTNPLTLVSGAMLLVEIGRLPAGDQQALFAVATEGEYRTPTCPSCGTKMVEREGDGRRFWGCRSFPRCRRTFADSMAD